MAEIEKENITQNGVYYVYMYRMGVRVSIHYYQFHWRTHIHTKKRFGSQKPITNALICTLSNDPAATPRVRSTSIFTVICGEYVEFIRLFDYSIYFL